MDIIPELALQNVQNVQKELFLLYKHFHIINFNLDIIQTELKLGALNYPGGFYSRYVYSKCIKCSDGIYSFIGSSSCIKCEEGMYANSEQTEYYLYQRRYY